MKEELINIQGYPDYLNADKMTSKQLRDAIYEGYMDYELGKYQEASKMIKEFREKHLVQKD